MPSEYQSLFDARGARYNRANRMFPEARAEEARLILDRVPLAGAALWLDVGAGGGFLAGRAARVSRAAAVGCDESAVFLGPASGYALRTIARYGELPFETGLFDAAASLAALHHAENPGAVVAEMLRVVRPGGTVAVGDVAAGSRAGAFLNEFVDAHTRMGHRGRFHSSDAWIGFLLAAGGRDASAAAERLHWRFATREDAITFCRELFGLEPETRDDDLDAELGRLGLDEHGGAWRLPWDMVFASAAA